MTTWLTSDTHYNHAEIINLCKRPCSSVDDMNSFMIDTWNALVAKKDRIFVLGDFAFVNKYGWEVEKIFAALNGEKHLVIGNHDEKNPRVMRLPWKTAEFITRIRDDNRKIVACHYPMTTWPGAQHGHVHAHGHSHGTLADVRPRRGDVGVDTTRWPFRAAWSAPLPFDIVYGILDAEKFDPTDHHGM